MHTTTDANGSCSVTLSESAQGLCRFEPTFFGDTAYAPANDTVSLTVGTRA